MRRSGIISGSLTKKVLFSGQYPPYHEYLPSNSSSSSQRGNIPKIVSSCLSKMVRKYGSILKLSKKALRKSHNPKRESLVENVFHKISAADIWEYTLILKRLARDKYPLVLTNECQGRLVRIP